MCEKYMKIRKLKKIKISAYLKVLKAWTIQIEVDLDKGVLISFYPDGTTNEKPIEHEMLEAMRKHYANI
jgi:hypothetical protein